MVEQEAKVNRSLPTKCSLPTLEANKEAPTIKNGISRPKIIRRLLDFEFIDLKGKIHSCQRLFLCSSSQKRRAPQTEGKEIPRWWWYQRGEDSRSSPSIPSCGSVVLCSWKNSRELSNSDHNFWVDLLKINTILFIQWVVGLLVIHFFSSIVARFSVFFFSLGFVLSSLDSPFLFSFCLCLSDTPFFSVFDLNLIWSSIEPDTIWAVIRWKKESSS